MRMRNALRPRSLCIIAVVAVLVGLATVAYVNYEPSGTALTEWRLHIDGAPHDVPLTLPNRLRSHFHNPETAYSLERELQLSPDQRGRPLTLTLVCFHDSLALLVDGVPVADAGDVDIGEHRYVIDGAMTNRAHIELALAARFRIASAVGFGVAPRVVQGVADRSPVALLNRYSQTTWFVLAGLFSFLYGILFVLEKHRRQYYLAATLTAVSLLIASLTMFRVVPLSRASLLVCGLAAVVGPIALLFFVHLTLGLKRPPRFWLIAFGLEAVLIVVAALVPPLIVATFLLYTVLNTALNIYLLVQCFRVARGTTHRYEARILLAGMLPGIVILGLETSGATSGGRVLGGLHLVAFSLVFVALSVAGVLAFQFVARQRTLQRTTVEVRRQVIERSRELADALALVAQQPTMSLVGRTLGERYCVVRRIGAGGMGTVYEVERVPDNQRLALKTLREPADTNLMARFAREAQLAAELNHPNLVPVLDVGITDGILYLVMELVDGGPLESERTRFGDLTWATPLLEQIAKGLAAIHARGVVHRDLKPANILLSHGVARIADFGLASLHELGALDETAVVSPRLTRASEVFGTAAYLAPELATSSRDAAPSSDMFSFGVVAYELLTGRAPFTEAPIASRMHGRAIVAAQMIGVGSALRSLVERCLDLEPTNRPTATEVVQQLQTSA
jgi:hypothetical protein